MSIDNVKTGQDGFWVDVQPDGPGVVQPDSFRLCITARNDYFCFRELKARDLAQLIETVAVAIGYVPRVNVFLKVDVGKPATRSRTSAKRSRRKK